MTTGKLMITVGLPLSGKLTFANKINHDDICDDYAIVHPDTIRLAIHGKPYIQTAEPYVWAVTETMVRSLLLSGNNVILVATNTTKERRQVWVKVAKELNTKLSIAMIDTPYDICVERNKETPKCDVSVIDRMLDQFQTPSMAEGFAFRITPDMCPPQIVRELKLAGKI